MAVNVDNVYQKVLALSDKEQRGYITPQEFNLLADKAQLEIFDSYFHDIKTAYHQPLKNQTVIGDELDMLSEKLQPFFRTTSVAYDSTNDILTLPAILHKLISVSRSGNIQLAEITSDEINYIQSNPLTQPTVSRPIFTRSTNSTITILPIPTTTSENFTVDYYAKPKPPSWEYVVVKGRAMYNGTDSTHFDLHACEEEPLVMRILQLAGIIIMKPGIVEVAMSDAARTKQEQNS